MWLASNEQLVRLVEPARELRLMGQVEHCVVPSSSVYVFLGQSSHTPELFAPTLVLKVPGGRKTRVNLTTEQNQAEGKSKRTCGTALASCGRQSEGSSWTCDVGEKEIIRNEKTRSRWIL